MKNEKNTQKKPLATIDELHKQIAEQSAKVKETKTTLASLSLAVVVMVVAIFITMDASLEALKSTNGMILLVIFGVIIMITIVPAFGIHTKQLVEERSKLTQHRAQLSERLNAPEGGELTIAPHGEGGQLTESQQQGELTQDSSHSK